LEEVVEATKTVFRVGVLVIVGAAAAATAAAAAVWEVG
jgi:hypothetical protein